MLPSDVCFPTPLLLNMRITESLLVITMRYCSTCWLLTETCFKFPPNWPLSSNLCVTFQHYKGDFGCCCQGCQSHCFSITQNYWPIHCGLVAYKVVMPLVNSCESVFQCFVYFRSTNIGVLNGSFFIKEVIHGSICVTTSSAFMAF